MRSRKRRSLSRIILAFGIALPGLIGILAVQAKAVATRAGGAESVLQANTPSATSTLPQTASSLLLSTSTLSPVNSLPTSSSSFPSGLYAYIQAPKGPLQQPYVILSAFSSLPRAVSVTIRGFVNSDEFVCTQSPCAINLKTSSRLVFAAYADTGESRKTVIASVSVTQTADGYFVTIDSVSQFNTFNNSCALAWGVSDQQNNITWDDFVQFPYELHTKKTLHTLATHLLLNGIVDAHDCPAGGLSIGFNWPTACGLERASAKMIEWQNQFDDYIWLASKDQGIPPKILKTLIEIESQFWPGNARFFLDEFGLGQVNQLGVDVLLRRDPTIFQSVCPGVLADCSRPYPSLEPQQQAMIRGAVVNLMDATCPSCENGIDLNKAKESVPLLARLLKANCQQVNAILKLTFKPDADANAATATAEAETQKKLRNWLASGDPAKATAAVATLLASNDTTTTSYEDLWRFTFLSYHSGLNCFQEAVVATRKAGKSVTWDN